MSLRRAAPERAVVPDSRGHGCIPLLTAEVDEHLIQSNLIEDVEARANERFGEAPSVTHRTGHEVGDLLPAK